MSYGGQKLMQMNNGNSKSKKTIVYESLKKKIIANILSPGESLNEIVLAKELKTSKTPVREAIQQLEKEGLIENIPGKGSFVSRFSFQDIRELFEIREILEVGAIRKAVARGDLNFEEAQRIRSKFASSESNENKTARNYFNAGDQIHTFIIESLRNNQLSEYWGRLQEHIIRMRLHFFNQVDQARSGDSFKEHLEIIDAMIAQDPVKAEKALRDHLRNSLEYLKNKI
jgi:DNA-binding GntR family transcriptional regulator